MHWMVCSVCYLGCMVVNINVLFAEWRITECDYILSDIIAWDSLAWNPLFIFRYRSRCCDNHSPCFTFPQLQTCSADCTEEGSCSSNIPSNFWQGFSFNFHFLIPNTIISFSPDKYSLLIFNVVLHYELNTFKIPKMV